METKNKSCEDRIMENLESCEEDLDLFYSILDDNLDPDDEDDALKIAKIEDNGYDEDSIYEYALGVSTKKVIRIDLSTGGPGSFIEAEVDDNNVTLFRDDGSNKQSVTTPKNQNSRIIQQQGSIEIINRVNTGGTTVITLRQN
jgi:hypothetical protein